MLASVLFTHTEQLPGYILGNDAQELPSVYDTHGALLLRQIYYPKDELLYVQWFGNLTDESVVAGAQAVLETQRELHFPLMLNDKQTFTGDWMEAMEWLEFEWLPQTHELGLRSFAYVFAPDMQNQLASLDFVNRASQFLAIQVFYGPTVASDWLRTQRPS